mmetsp:Transcript_32131/g.86057  ORF Transcript_32131/g.86057 Transcript_32131/m.86057 type:complete len:231 (+) Transcript_32131:211-903(+)
MQSTNLKSYAPQAAVHLWSGRSLRQVEMETILDDAAHASWKVIRDVRAHFLDENLGNYLLHVVAVVVGQWTPEDLYQDAPSRPDIHFLCDLALVVVALRRHVSWRSPVAAFLQGDVRLVHGLRKPKVTDLRVVLLVKHYVQRLEIAVHDWGCQAVQERNALSNLQSHLRLLGEAECRLRLVQELMQRPATHEFSHDAEIRRLKARTDETHQPFMPKVLQGRHLLAEFIQL